MRKKNILFKPLIYLAIIFLILFVTSKFISNQNIKDYISDLSIEILGALIVIIFINIYLNNYEEKLAEKRESIALKLLKPAMRHHFETLFIILKASTEEEGKIYSTKELGDFFNDDFIENIRRLDVTAEAPIYPKISWIPYLQSKFIEINSRYDSILNKYAVSLSPDLVEVIEGIKNSTFHDLIVRILPTTLSYSNSKESSLPNDIFSELFTKEDICEPYLVLLKTLLNHTINKPETNDFYKIDKEDWRNDIAPKIGSSRIK